MRTLQTVGVGALQSKILCKGHNERLSRIDAAGRDLLRCLDAIDKRPETVAALTRFSGEDVERWFLKTICGLVAARAAGNGGAVPDEWKEALVRGAWAARCGLYAATSPERILLARELVIRTVVDATTQQITAVRFRVAGVGFNLLLDSNFNGPMLGVHRVRGLIFVLRDGTERRIEFLWPFESDDWLPFLSAGPAVKGGPPDWDDWIQG